VAEGRATEGSPVTVSVVASDAAGVNDPLTYEFDFDGDGVFEVSNDSGSAQHTYPDDGTYPVTVRVTDDEGGSATTVLDVEVLNVAPTIALSAAPIVPEGQVYTLNLGE